MKVACAECTHKCVLLGKEFTLKLNPWPSAIQCCTK